MISEALQRPIGPLAAWQWGIVIGGGYLGYRVLSGKGLFPSSGASSNSGTAVSAGDATGGITQGPQGDPGPVGPPGAVGPPGPIGTTTTTQVGLTPYEKTLVAAIATLKKEIAHNKALNTPTSRANAAKEASRLATYEARLHNYLNPPVPVAVSPGTTPAVVTSLVNPPSTTIGNSAGNAASLVMPAQSTATTVSMEPVTSHALPVSAGTG